MIDRGQIGGGHMADGDTIIRPEMLQVNLRLTCLCAVGVQPAQIEIAKADNDSFAKSVSAAGLECPKCHEPIVVEILSGTCYDRSVT